MEQWRREAQEKLDLMPPQAKEVRLAAEEDLYFFAQLINPGYVYGSIHREIFRWMSRYNLFGTGGALTSNKLIMLPRAHLKSHMVATWAAWMIVRHPEITILYVSATADLAMTQLDAIKNILDSDMFQKYWPEYINPEKGKRKKWSATRITIDHIKRVEEGVRDATISTAGLTTNTTGWHADVICADDLVVPENAYTEEGRESVSKKASQFTSIRNAGGFTMACGTRYHPNDVYKTWKDQVAEDYNAQGEHIGKTHIWEFKEYAVEKNDIFIWPRTVRSDGKAFGFDPRVLARIKGEYSDRTQFFAQYYNDPNDPESARMGPEVFQYANPRFLRKDNGAWHYNGKRLNIYAAVDFAFSLSSNADYTAIVVVGIDYEKQYYILDIDRFKSFKANEYFNHIAALHSKWGFKKLQAEVSVAQKTIVESIKDFIREKGLRLSVVEFRPSRAEGSKEERIAAVLEPKYQNYDVWHFEGGWTQAYEEELMQARPAHDDMKDAAAGAFSIAVAPMKPMRDKMADWMPRESKSRFGGFQ